MTDDPRPAASLAEIRALLAALPTASATARAAAPIDVKSARSVRTAGGFGDSLTVTSSAMPLKNGVRFSVGSCGA